MRLFLLILFLITACSRAPERKPPAPTPSGYAYTERTYADPPSTVQRAGVALLRELSRDSSPSVPGEVVESDEETSTGWVYSSENGQAVRRRYQLNYVPAETGTLVVTSIQEERQSEDTWQAAVPNNALYHAFFIRLQSKVRKIR